MVSVENIIIYAGFWKGRNVESLKEKEKEKWIRQLKGWMLAEGIPLTKQEKWRYGTTGMVKADLISFFERVLDFLTPDEGGNETEKDIWRLDRLDIEIKENLIKEYKTLNFTKIFQADIREIGRASCRERVYVLV